MYIRKWNGGSSTLLKVNRNSSSISSYVQVSTTQNQPLKSLLLENIVSPSKVDDKLGIIDCK
jgi:hypothetical protein